MPQPNPIPEDFGITHKDVEQFKQVSQIMKVPVRWVVLITVLLIVVGILLMLVELLTTFSLTEFGTSLIIRSGAAGASLYLMLEIVRRVILRPMLRINRRFRAAEDFLAAVSEPQPPSL